MNSSICCPDGCPDDVGHRDFTTSEARDFAEFSKIVPANLLDTRSTNLFFVLVRLSAVLIFLWNGNLGSLFRYR